jgi:hypothetical protein
MFVDVKGGFKAFSDMRIKIEGGGNCPVFNGSEFRVVVVRDSKCRERARCFAGYVCVGCEDGMHNTQTGYDGPAVFI